MGGIRLHDANLVGAKPRWDLKYEIVERLLRVVVEPDIAGAVGAVRFQEHSGGVRGPVQKA